MTRYAIPQSDISAATAQPSVDQVRRYAIPTLLGDNSMTVDHLGQRLDDVRRHANAPRGWRGFLEVLRAYTADEEPSL